MLPVLQNAPGLPGDPVTVFSLSGRAVNGIQKLNGSRYNARGVYIMKSGNGFGVKNNSVEENTR